MRRRRLLATSFAAALVFSAAGCTTVEEDAPSQVSETSEVSVGLPPTSEISPGPTTEPMTTTADDPPARECENQSMDLLETAFGAWLGAQIIPTDQAGTSYYFKVVDNKFSPCAELSWVTLEGSNGNPAQDNGNGNGLVDTVVFFNGADLITDPAPVQFRDVTTVKRVNDHELLINYRDTSAGVTEERQLSYGFEDGELHGEWQLPAEQLGNVRLDLGRAGPEPVGAPRPFGNAHYRPWDQERSIGRQYSLMMGDEKITCDFATFNGVQLVCYSETALPWPMVSDSRKLDDTRANIAWLNFQAPWEIRTDAGTFPPKGSNFEMLPPDSVTRIGDIFIDTRGDVVKIHDANWAYLLGEGVAEPVEVPTFQLDTSRHPKDLLPWEG